MASSSDKPGTSSAPDSPDTAEQKAYRRGKSAGYSEGVAHGWDACMMHVREAFNQAIAAALTEPDAVKQHREAVARKRAGQEASST